ncbi:MAG: CDP-alcohol phosphatidyltransferase family protein [Inhella sp.]
MRAALLEDMRHLPGPWVFTETFCSMTSAASSRAASIKAQGAKCTILRCSLTIPTLLTRAHRRHSADRWGVSSPPGRADRNLIATVLFVTVALTDWLDGYLARRLNQTSSFGAFLDPADKLRSGASPLVLLELQRVSALFALVIIGREIATSALREWMHRLARPRVRRRTWWAS